MFPEKIGRYIIKSELGRGGMASVYLARDPRFKRDVAIKVIPPQFLDDQVFRARFEREAQAIASLEHPAIVPVYDYGDENGQPYLVMRYMPGGSLAERMKKGVYSLPDTAHIIARLASALDQVHHQGIIHRDLKPANILFDQYDEAYLSDFGIAYLAEAAATLTGDAIIGTPAYMSPEQAQGGVIDKRSDIYALGVIVFQMLSGKQPFQATTPMGVVMKHITEPVPSLQNINASFPPGIDAVISKAMAKNREQRYASGQELVNDLQKICTGYESIPSIRNIEEKTSSQTDVQLEPGWPEPQIDIGKKAGAKPMRGKFSPWLYIISAGVGLISICGFLALLGFGSRLLMGAKPSPTIPIIAATLESSPTPVIVSIPTATPSTSPTLDRIAVTIFQDDFSDPSTGWTRDKEAGAMTDYDYGSYRIFVDRPNMIYWANPNLKFKNVHIQVEASKVAGADDNYFGVICRYQDDDNFYILAITSDGFYNIGKYKDGQYSNINKDSIGYSNAIHQGKTTNLIDAECNENNLALYANGIRLAQVEDSDFSTGDVGLAAAAFELPGTNILFDNFIAKIP